MAIRCKSSAVRVVWLSRRSGVEPAQGQLAKKRVELAAMSKCGSRMRSDAFDRHERADQEDEVGRDMKLVSADEADQVAEQEAEVDAVERQVGVSVRPAR